MADDSAADSAQLSIKVVSSGSETLAVTVPRFASATVGALKALVAAQDGARFPAAAQRLIFQGQILQDERLLRDYGVTSGCALHLTLTRGATAAAAAPAATPSAAATPVFEAQLRALLQRMQADAGYAGAAQTLLKICENVERQPHEPKFRRLRLANAALRSRLLDRAHGLECAKLLGFQDGIEEVSQGEREVSRERVGLLSWECVCGCGDTHRVTSCSCRQRRSGRTWSLAGASSSKRWRRLALAVAQPPQAQRALQCRRSAQQAAWTRTGPHRRRVSCRTR